jgi:hypothetical protein
MKNWLTVFHCLIAVAVYWGGLEWATSVKNEHPFGAFLILLGALLLPIIAATRVSWACGYDAGKAESRPLPSVEQPPYMTEQPHAADAIRAGKPPN